MWKKFYRNKRGEFENYTSRLEGIVSGDFHHRIVLMIGCGGGSNMAVDLARLAPKEIRLDDFDNVELTNLSRTAYSVSDLGRPKVVALRNHLRAANPFLSVKAFQRDICRVSRREIENLFEGVDVVVAGTDRFEAQARINEIAVATGTPTIFIGIHEYALGGMIVWSIPGLTPCYYCVAKERYKAYEWEGERKTDLKGARGSIADITFIDAVALKVLIAILERGQDSLMGRFFEKMRYRTQIIVRTHPEYHWGDVDIFDLVLDDLPRPPLSSKDYKQELKEEAFFAMDTLWLKTEFDLECLVCRDKQPREK